MSPQQIAVAVHDVEPATFERCALIRDWLDDYGIAKATLLVIPACDMHPFHDRCPELADWIGERLALGDAVAQHGFHHGGSRRSHPHDAEFVGLDAAEARRAVEAGRRVLRLAGLQPRGFVAPAYVYTVALEQALEPSFRWWAGRDRIVTDLGQVAAATPAVTPRAALGARRFAAPWSARASALLGGPLLRLDVHPADLDQPGRIGALEQVLRRAGRREPVTYDELALAAGGG